MQKNWAAPNYTEEARVARLEGLILFRAVIDEDGNAKVTDIIKPLGMGLDENAVRTIEEIWKFSPAMRDGVPVETDSYIDVRFKLLN